MTECPLGCGADVPPRGLAKHLAEDCPEARADRADDDPDQTELVTDGGQPAETVLACPECDSTGVVPTVRDETDHNYYCRHCTARFDDPTERERYNESGLAGLAGRLSEMDPDDVDGDHLVTDGGTPVVYYATGQYDVYHADRDCRYLKQATSIRESPLGNLAGFRDPCGVCGSGLEETVVTDGGRDIDERLTRLEREVFGDEDDPEVRTDGGQSVDGTEQVALSRNPGELQVAKLGRDGRKAMCPDCEGHVGHTKSGGKPLPKTDAEAFGWSCRDCNLTFPSNCDGPDAPGFNDSMAGIEVKFRDGETRWVPVPARYVDTDTDRDIRTDGGTTTDRTACWRCGFPRPTYESCPECEASCKPLTRREQQREMRTIGDRAERALELVRQAEPETVVPGLVFAEAALQQAVTEACVDDVVSLGQHAQRCLAALDPDCEIAGRHIRQARQVLEFPLEVSR